MQLQVLSPDHQPEEELRLCSEKSGKVLEKKSFVSRNFHNQHTELSLDNAFNTQKLNRGFKEHIKVGF